MITSEASPHGISFGHDDVSQICAIELGRCHECRRQRFALQLRHIIRIVAEAKVQCYVGHAIGLPYCVPIVSSFTPSWISGQRRQPRLLSSTNKLKLVFCFILFCFGLF